MPTTNVSYEGALWSERRPVPRIANPNNFDQVRAAMDAISGWLLPEEGQWLYSAARTAPGGAIVELGSFCGKSTVALAAGSLTRATPALVTAVDTFEGTAELDALGLDTFDEFRANVRAAGVESQVAPIRALTSVAAQSFHAPIALLFIDADHSYEGVTRDFLDWYPKVIPGGLIAFHDSLWPGPQRLLHERVYGRLRDTRRVGTLVWCRKARAAPADHLRAWKEDALRGGRFRPVLRLAKRLVHAVRH